jgi:hypothetical protein
MFGSKSLSGDLLEEEKMAQSKDLLLVCPNKNDFQILQRILLGNSFFTVRHTESYNDTCRIIGSKYFKAVLIDTEIKSGKFG